MKYTQISSSSRTATREKQELKRRELTAADEAFARHLELIDKIKAEADKLGPRGSSFES